LQRRAWLRELTPEWEHHPPGPGSPCPRWTPIRPGNPQESTPPFGTRCDSPSEFAFVHFVFSCCFCWWHMGHMELHALQTTCDVDLLDVLKKRPDSSIRRPAYIVPACSRLLVALLQASCVGIKLRASLNPDAPQPGPQPKTFHGGSCPDVKAAPHDRSTETLRADVSQKQNPGAVVGGTRAHPRPPCLSLPVWWVQVSVNSLACPSLIIALPIYIAIACPAFGCAIPPFPRRCRVSRSSRSFFTVTVDTQQPLFVFFFKFSSLAARRSQH
jgi:hypothetical protein